MIKTREELRYYLECDRIALRQSRLKPRLLGDEEWKYERWLRKAEYYQNRNKVLFSLAKLNLHRYSISTGFQIALNTCGPGLSLAHRGTVIINSKSRVGENCRIQTGVTLGTSNGSNIAPNIGNNVFLGEGCKIIGDVSIPDNCNIGANAVVVKTITEQGSYGGVPAKKLSDNTSEGNIVKATEIVQGKDKSSRKVYN